MTFEELAAAIKGPIAADENQVAAFEALVGHRLPEDYRKFLMLSGGGHGCFDFAKDGKEELIGAFLGLHEEGYLSLFQTVRAPDYALPLETVCIADDAGGNPIILSLGADRFGEIFLVDHEVCPFAKREARPTIEAAGTAGFVFSLAPTFSSFVAHLSLNED